MPNVALAVLARRIFGYEDDHDPDSHEINVARSYLDSALSVCPVLGLTEEEMEAVLDNLRHEVGSDERLALEANARTKLRAALTAMRGEE